MSFTTPAYFEFLKAPLIRSDLKRFFFIDGDWSWYEECLSDPTHIGPSAHVVWPIVGQEILNGDMGGGFRRIQRLLGSAIAKAQENEEYWFREEQPDGLFYCDVEENPVGLLEFVSLVTGVVSVSVVNGSYCC
uniref:Uncharacterized protein n=1 Tax=Brassica oleracea var. oleracea TaxID=109376 RepID=A0A0D2ZUG9_BRAOL